MSFIESLLETKKPLPKELPDKPSELLALALSDLEKAECSDQYIIDMLYWHEPDISSGKCLVCLAGAVMAFSLYFSPDEDFFFVECSFEISRKIFALNNFRLGYIFEAFNNLNISFPEGMARKRDVTSYRNSPTQFKSDMRNLIKDLRECGL